MPYGKNAAPGMRDQALFDKIDLHLIRVLHTVLTERTILPSFTHDQLWHARSHAPASGRDDKVDQ